MKKLTLLAALCAFAMINCEPYYNSLEPEQKRQRMQKMYKKWGESFEKYEWHWKNWNTGVCYSMYGRPSREYFSHTAVPCTEKVMAKIVNSHPYALECKKECKDIVDEQQESCVNDCIENYQKKLTQPEKMEQMRKCRTN